MSVPGIEIMLAPLEAAEVSDATMETVEGDASVTVTSPRPSVATPLSLPGPTENAEVDEDASFDLTKRKMGSARSDEKERRGAEDVRRS